jgi:hypothetical protein
MESGSARLGSLDGAWRFTRTYDGFRVEHANMAPLDEERRFFSRELGAG